MHFCPHLYTPRKTSWSVTHPEIALGQARLTPKFFADELPEKKVYLGSMSILSILLSLESGCHILLLDVVLIGQLRIYLMNGVEILDCKPIEYISYRLKVD
jgi:hypothetical protein